MFGSGWDKSDGGGRRGPFVVLSIPDAAPAPVHGAAGVGPLQPPTLTGAAISSADIPKKSNAGLVIGGAVLSLLVLVGAGALIISKLAFSTHDAAAPEGVVSSAPVATTAEPAGVDSAPDPMPEADAAPDEPAASASSAPDDPPPVAAAPPSTRTVRSEAPPKSTKTDKPPKPATTEVDRGF